MNDKKIYTRKQTLNIVENNGQSYEFGNPTGPMFLKWIPFDGTYITMDEYRDVSLQLDYRDIKYENVMIFRISNFIHKTGISSSNEAILLSFLKEYSPQLHFLRVGHFYLINFSGSEVSTKPSRIQNLMQVSLPQMGLKYGENPNATRLRLHKEEEISEFVASWTQPKNILGKIDYPMVDEMADMLFYNPSIRPIATDVMVLYNLMKNTIGGDRYLFAKSKELTTKVREVRIVAKLTLEYADIVECLDNCRSKLSSRDPENLYAIIPSKEVDVLNTTVFRLYKTGSGDLNIPLGTITITANQESKIYDVEALSQHIVGNGVGRSYDFFTTGNDFDNLNEEY